MKPKITKHIFLLFGLLLIAGPLMAVQVTFRVNMSRLTVAAAGVHIAGDFQSEAGFPADWNPATTQLSDSDANGIYELKANLPTGIYRYKFINGTAWANAEANLAGCGSGSTLNRMVVVSDEDLVLPVSDFNFCPMPATNYPVYNWSKEVFYLVFVRSFYDSDGNGVGDFAGLMSKLDYLNDGDPNTNTDLGVTALWLMPIMPSPSYHGYNITNYKAIQPAYGSMAGFDAFMAAAHARGIKVILDLVLNHTSEEHPWFTQSSANTTNPKRDWYVWSNVNPGFPGPEGQTVWKQKIPGYYYGVFNPFPDLNWNSRALRDTMWNAVSFWLNKGVDGFRLDAVKYLVEENILLPSRVLTNTAGTYSVLQEFNNVVKSINPNAFTVGEAWQKTEEVAPYVVHDRLDACFEFGLSGDILNAANVANTDALYDRLLAVNQAYPTLKYGSFLTNHDQDRSMSQLGNSLRKAKVSASVMLTVPGVPFIYYGEEIGITGSGAHEDVRTPMQWNANANAGFTTGSPWRGVNTNFAVNNVAAQQQDSASLLNHYKKLIRLRTGHDALQKGYYLPAVASTGTVLAFARIYGEESIIIAANFGAGAASPGITLGKSTLQAGTYYVYELYSGRNAGTVAVDTLGRINAWSAVSALGTLPAGATWLLSLSKNPVGVMPQAGRLNVQVMPNPASGQVEINLGTEAEGNGTASLYDLNGRLHQQKTFTGSRTSLQTNDLPSGSYLLRIESGQSRSVQRLVVVH
ncbi:MAG: alpha-amylase family glycosyl hydrolase [Bacteroidota bacterium]